MDPMNSRVFYKREREGEREREREMIKYTKIVVVNEGS